jgi:SAM-dependent methyltransferase
MNAVIFLWHGRPAGGEVGFRGGRGIRSEKPGIDASNAIGKVYLGREIARVMGHEGADWLERPGREGEEAPSKAISMMDLTPTDVVADVGAGTGYFSFRIARQVPQGKVLAENIDPDMIAYLKRTIAEKGVKNVEPVQGTIEDPKLPENGVDVVLFVDAYHEFDHPREMRQAIVKVRRRFGFQLPRWLEATKWPRPVGEREKSNLRFFPVPGGWSKVPRLLISRTISIRRRLE